MFEDQCFSKSILCSRLSGLLLLEQHSPPSISHLKPTPSPWQPCEVTEIRIVRTAGRVACRTLPKMQIIKRNNDFICTCIVFLPVPRFLLSQCRQFAQLICCSFHFHFQPGNISTEQVPFPCQQNTFSMAFLLPAPCFSRSVYFTLTALVILTADGLVDTVMCSSVPDTPCHLLNTQE